MTSTLAPAEQRDASTTAPRAAVVTRAAVLRRRALTLLLVVGLLTWAWSHSLPEGPVVNGSAGSLLSDLLGRALDPALDAAFLRVVADAVLVTLAFAALGAAGALVMGLLGGLVLSDVAWPGRVPPFWRAVRGALRTVLVALRSIHELVWALLLVSVLGLDPLVAVLALVIPFGAQTAQVFGETFDNADTRTYKELRRAGAPQVSALAYALVPAASPVLLSYSFYRFECSVRSTVLLGFVGVGGLGQELVVSLQSRNWEEVWTLVYVLLALSAFVELWSSRVRREVAAPTARATTGRLAGDPEAGVVGTVVRVRETGRLRRTWSRGTLWLLAPALVVSWLAADLTLAGLSDPLTWELTQDLLSDLLPPAAPDGGIAVLVGAVLDTLAMAVLAMALAVVITVVVGGAAASRGLMRLPARVVLLVLRSVPPTVWAVLALFVLFPGVLPGALALGLYAAGILGRLVAEAWEGVDRAPATALERSGTPRWLASLAAVVPVSIRQLLTYTLYRFEISVRDTAVVGVVGAAGLGRLFAEAMASFRFPVVGTLLLASFAVSAGVELLGRRIRRSLTR